MNKEVIIYQAPPSSPTNSEELRRGGRPKGACDKLPRTKRAPTVNLPPMQFTQRDMNILLLVYVYRMLTAAQIQRLLAPDASRTRIGQRLQLLFQHGYLLRIEQMQALSEPRKPYVYVLDREGAAQVAAYYGCLDSELDWSAKDRQVKPFFIEHFLLINDVRLELTASLARHGYILEAWHDERALKRSHKDDLIRVTAPNGSTEDTRLYPDAYCAFRTDRLRLHRFLEIDRGTETVRSGGALLRGWARKVACYQTYYPLFFERRYQAKGMVVLTITTSEQRLAHMKQVTESQGGNEMFWFTTFDRLNAPGIDILTSPIWNMAAHERSTAVIDF